MRRREERSPEALTLLSLRHKRGWSQKELITALGRVEKSQFSQYEGGDRPLSREQLDVLLAPLGYPPEAAEVLLFAFGLLAPDSAREDAGPLDVPPERRLELERTAIAAGWTAMDLVRTELFQYWQENVADLVRRDARDLWPPLKAASREDRHDAISALPELRSWALAVRICEASVRAAAHRVEEARDLADLALFLAERVPGGEGWRSRLRGYAWAHVANARRVANDFHGADEAFSRAWELWRAGRDPGLLPEWRLLDLEASLRKEQHRFAEALELLDRARAACGDDPVAAARILLNKEHVCDKMGDVEGALAALTEAAPFVERAGDSRLLFALRFNMADDLCHLERYGEAGDRLPEVRDLAVEQGNELNLIRVVWLEARIAAGQGRTAEAVAGLEQVRRDFTVRQLPYDAALSSLDLAVLWLRAGRTREVRDLVPTMAWICEHQGIRREALAALSLFCEAARQETATAELARRAISEIEKVRPPASRSVERPRAEGH